MLKGRVGRRGLLEVLALSVGILGILVSAFLAISAQARSERGQAEARMQATSTLAQAYVHEQTASLAALVAAYADRLTASGALEPRSGSQSALADADRDLKRLAESRPAITLTFLTDARGVLLDLEPADPALAGKSFAFRDWYRGAVRTTGPYVSEAYQSSALGRPFVIATSVALRGKVTAHQSGPVLGVLAAAYSLTSFQEFVAGYADRTGIELLILDQRGVLIADGGHPSRPGTSLEERRAAGRRAVAGQGVISAKVTDPDTGWTVISAVPVGVALGPTAGFRRLVLLAAGLLIFLILGGAAAVEWVRYKRRVADREVSESEERAAAERQRAREDIDRFFNLSQDLLCIAGTDGYFQQLNPAWPKLLGFEAEELLGQPFASYIHPDDVAKTFAEIEKLETGAPTIAFENRYRCSDGSYRDLLWNVTPVPEEGLLYAVARDITDRTLAEQAAARLAALVDSSADAIVGASLDGVVTSWNRGAEQIFGYRPDEIVGHLIGILAPPGEDGQQDMLTRVGRGEAISPYEVSRVRRDGQLIEVALTTSPVLDPGGTVSGISVIARDISETKRTAEALSAIIATASDGFVSMDAGGLITEWNHRAEVLFGWSRHEAIGRLLADLIIPESKREAHNSGLRRVLDGGAGRILDQLVEVSAMHRDGREIPVELSVWRVSSGPGGQFSAFLRDISERQQIARDVAEARDQAVEASRLKSVFLATMSHEIRTPMNGVIGLTGLLLRSDLDDTQRRYLDGISVAGNALLAVINDILDFSKIEAGALDLDDATVNLSDLLEEVIEIVSESARSKDVELLGFCSPSVPNWLRGDPVRIRQILLNLATNAVKFTDHGEVFIHIHPELDLSLMAIGSLPAGEAVGVRFEVTDTGIGIEPSERARLFDPFAQADSSTTRRFGGTGLGLAICRDLVEAMGGQIGVESRRDQGSTFWCVIPFRIDTGGQEVPRPLDASLEGRRVLVVDDNQTNRLILTQQLSSWAMLPTALASGELALDHVRASSGSGESYDLVIADMHMPGMDGLELGMRINARLNTAPLPVVLITSGETVPSQTARDAGIVACLSKPVQESHLRDCLIRVTAGNTQTTVLPPPSPSAPVPGVPTLGSLLLVEDNEINQMVAVGILTRLGYGVDIAGDGVQALEMVARTTYQAVLMDCQMPNMDGFQATEELRRRERVAQDLDQSGEATSPRLPIIAMTAAALKEDREHCLAVGMDDYLAKPIQIDQLASALTRWTGGAATSSAPAADMTRVGSAQEAIANRLDDLRDNVAEGLVSRLVASFLKRAPDYLAELADTLQRHDVQAFTNAAHSFKGAAGNLGAHTVATLCDALETLGHDSQLKAAPDLLGRLHVEYDAVRLILEDVAA